MNIPCLITFRSVTFAQKAQNRLSRAGIDTQLGRTPQGLSDRGCSYCLRLREQAVYRAVELLRQEEFPFQRLFASVAGRWEEREL